MLDGVHARLYSPLAWKQAFATACTCSPETAARIVFKSMFSCRAVFLVPRWPSRCPVFFFLQARGVACKAVAQEFEIVFGPPVVFCKGAARMQKLVVFC